MDKRPVILIALFVFGWIFLTLLFASMVRVPTKGWQGIVIFISGFMISVITFLVWLALY